MRSLMLRLLMLLVAGWLGVKLAWPAPPQVISLNGDWNFLADPGGNLRGGNLASVQNVRPTRVPSSWQ